MKKIVAILLLVFLLVLSTSSVMAEEITFCDIPWFSSPGEALKLIKERFGLEVIDVRYSIVNEHLSQHWFNHEGILWENDDVGYYNSYEVPQLVCSLSIPNLKVAGYNVDGAGSSYNMELYFLPEITENGTNYECSKEKGRLWRAIYSDFRFSKNDEEKGVMSKDLRDKLTSLYGEEQSYRFCEKMIFDGSEMYGYKSYWEVEGSTIDWITRHAFSKYNSEVKGVRLDYRCNLDIEGPSIVEQLRIIERIKAEKRKKELLDQIDTGVDGL